MKKQIRKFLGFLTGIVMTLCVSSASAQVSFVPDTNPGCKPLPVYFTNTSTAGEVFYWNFDDGGDTLTGGDASHTYINSGRYRVQMQGYDTTGSNGDMGKWSLAGMYQLEIRVYGSQGIYPSSNPACPGEPVRFWLNGAGTSYSWDFGDGSTSVLQDPDHTYAAEGTYTVQLILGHPCGTDTVSQIISVDSTAGPNANFRIEPQSKTSCPFDAFRFQYDGYENPAYTFDWDFGDGNTATGREITHSYSASGPYYVTLTVTNGCGNSNTHIDSVVIDAGASFPFIGLYIPSTCPGESSQFSLYGSQTTFQNYLWDFGDGSGTSTEARPLYTYADTGTYNVSVLITNGCGNDTTLTGTAVVDTGLVPQPIGPDDFGTPGGASGNCPGDSVLFYTSRIGNVVWDFGDGATAQATEIFTTPEGYVVLIVKHPYADTGSYTATITYTNGCGNSTSSALAINIGSLEPASGDFVWAAPQNGSNYFACEAVNFVALGGSVYEWDFGDGTTDSTGSGFYAHAYGSPGSYDITLKGTNGCGNSFTITKSILIDSLDVYAMTADAACAGDSSGAIDITISGGAPPLSYTWSNGALTEDISNLSAGIYSVTVSDNNGCKTYASFTVNEPTPLVLSGSMTPSSSCGNVDGTATVTVSGGISPYAYTWDTSPVQSITTATGLSAGSYNVTITDANACTAVHNVLIYDTGGPTATISSSSNASCFNACDGSATASATGGTPSYTFSWNTTPTQSIDTATNLCAGTYVVTVTDAMGCVTLSSVTIAEPSPFKPTITQSSDSLVSSVASSYQWNMGGTPIGAANGQSYHPASDGFYNVTATDGSGCTGSSDSIYFTVTGIAVSGAGAPQISLAPNPFTDKINLSYQLLKPAVVSVEIFNLLGEKVFTVVDQHQQAGLFTYTLGTTSFGYTEGIYFVRLKFDDQIINKRIVKVQ